MYRIAVFTPGWANHFYEGPFPAKHDAEGRIHKIAAEYRTRDFTVTGNDIDGYTVADDEHILRDFRVEIEPVA